MQIVVDLKWLNVTYRTPVEGNKNLNRELFWLNWAREAAGAG